MDYRAVWCNGLTPEVIGGDGPGSHCKKKPLDRPEVGSRTPQCILSPAPDRWGACVKNLFDGRQFNETNDIEASVDRGTNITLKTPMWIGTSIIGLAGSLAGWGTVARSVFSIRTFRLALPRISCFGPRSVLLLRLSV